MSDDAVWVDSGDSAPVKQHAGPGQELAGTFAIRVSLGAREILKGSSQYAYRKITVRLERLIADRGAGVPLCTAHLGNAPVRVRPQDGSDSAVSIRPMEARRCSR